MEHDIRSELHLATIMTDEQHGHASMSKPAHIEKERVPQILVKALEGLVQ